MSLPAALAGFAFVVGSWEDPSTGARETWVVAGDRLVGVGFFAPGTDGVRFEVLEITADAYVARPGGGEPVAFALARAAEGRAAWVNPAHDFPRRIRYRARGDDALQAKISGPGGAMRWRWVRRDPTPSARGPGDVSADGQLAFTVGEDGAVVVWQRAGADWAPLP